MRQPPLRGQPMFAGKRVLLIDPHQPTRAVRASVLQSYGVEVHVADSLTAAHCLWRPEAYAWILLDVRRYPPEETFAFYEQVRDASPRERFAFLIGPPRYLSVTWPYQFGTVESEIPQWSETVKHFLFAA
jgi:DNA-binding NtrC family response regulator